MGWNDYHCRHLRRTYRESGCRDRSGIVIGEGGGQSLYHHGGGNGVLGGNHADCGEGRNGEPGGIGTGTASGIPVSDGSKDSFARRYIATNMVANFLGLGWAATPAGLSAMKELKRLEETEGRATSAMCDFLIINISSLQLIPVNIIAYRSQYGSVSPAAIVGPAILATTVSTLAAVVFIKIRQGCARWFLKE